MKQCNSSTCDLKGQLQPLENFRKNKNMPDGLERTCIICKKKYYRKNKKRIIAQNVANAKKDPEKQKDYLAKYPFSRASLRQTEIPFLLMVRMPLALTFSVIQLSSSGIKNFLV